jgi:histidinol dehydrogenase
MSLTAKPLRLSTASIDFEAQFAKRLHWSADTDHAIEQRVADILADVRARGDAAVLEYTARFDGLQAASMVDLELTQADFKNAFDGLPAPQREALQSAARRVRSYHEAQKKASGESWTYRDEDGTLLGQKVTPLDRVGIYVPGGKAAYPSSLIMNAVPAHVAGVGEIIMVVPTPVRGSVATGGVGEVTARRGERNELVLAAAHVAGVTRAFTIGGAQAVAALAYGTATVPKVDKITGPGNAYVASAKRRVFGTVGIDMIAGPSEILVLADGSTSAEWVAMDLFSQAEHDELAQSILLCPDAAYLDAVQARHRPPAAHHAARGHHRQEPERSRRADPDARHGRGLRHQQPHRARTPGSIQPRAAPLGAAAAARRCHLPGCLHQREPGRLLRRPQPCAAHQRHGPFFFPSGRVRLPETQQPDRGQCRRRAAAGHHRRRAGLRRRPAGARAGRRAAPVHRAPDARRQVNAMTPPSPLQNIRQDIQSMHAYAIQDSTGMVKLDAMENPFSLPPELQKALGERLGAVAINRYPGARIEELKQALARYVDLPDGLALMLGNGSDELISLLAMGCDIPGASILAPCPAS